MPSWVARIDTPRRVLEERTTAAVDGPSELELRFEQLGSDGRFIAVGCSVPAWLTFYASYAAQVADAERPIDQDPPLGTGVLLDLRFDGETSWLYPSPGSTYSNAEVPLQPRLWAAVRTEQAGPHSATVSVLALVEYDVPVLDQGPP